MSTEHDSSKHHTPLPPWATWSLVIWGVFFFLLFVTIVDGTDKRDGGQVSAVALLVFSPIFITTFCVDIYRIYLRTFKK